MTRRAVKPICSLNAPMTRVYRGDCRDVLPALRHVRGKVDLVFADPPFNWRRAYENTTDALPRSGYITFTHDWLAACVEMLAPTGSLWVNIPDDWAAEIVVELKQMGLTLINWNIWHYRFGQNTRGRFINSKVHALYFAMDERQRTWNGDEILEDSDRAAVYGDPRTNGKRDGSPDGKRVPFDVWQGEGFARITGNNAERRPGHDNQLPEAYLARVIKACSNPGDLVLDPFLGSGTTLTVARALKRRGIGIERGPKTARSAIERIKEGQVRDVHAPVGLKRKRRAAA